MHLALLLAFSMAAVAGPFVCGPILEPDEQPVSFACPGIGATLPAIPGTAWNVSFEDLPLWVGSRDYNEMMAEILFSDFDMTVIYLGTNGSLFDQLLIGGVPIFGSFSNSPGDFAVLPVTSGINVPLAFRARGAFYDATYQAGSQNVYVSCINCPETETPEPRSVILLVTGLALCMLIRKALPRWRK